MSRCAGDTQHVRGQPPLHAAQTAGFGGLPPQQAACTAGEDRPCADFFGRFPSEGAAVTAAHNEFMGLALQEMRDMYDEEPRLFGQRPADGTRRRWLLKPLKVLVSGAAIA